MIELLGNRLNSGFCLMCGTDLIIPWNDYQCCAEHTAFIEQSQNIIRMSKDYRRHKRSISSRDVMRQIKPIGGIPE